MKCRNCPCKFRRDEAYYVFQNTEGEWRTTIASTTTKASEKNARCFYCADREQKRRNGGRRPKR